MPYFGCDVAVHTLYFLAFNLCVLGFPDQAVEKVDKALVLARELTHPFSLCMALICLAIVHCLRGESTAASNSAEAACQFLTFAEVIEQSCPVAKPLHSGVSEDAGFYYLRTAQIKLDFIHWRGL